MIFYLLPKIRQMALNHAGGSHPWFQMDDEQLLRSAGLYGRDISTGEERYNLAALMLLGRDDVILDVAPAYVTDALVRMYVENANRAASSGLITVDNLEPNPKNPIIAAFFRNIGYADQLGSGVRNLFKYTKYYSGQEPQFIEGDVFRIVVPLDEQFSYDSEIGTVAGAVSADKVPISADKMPITDLELQQETIYRYVRQNGSITSRQAEELLQIKQRRARAILAEMVTLGILEKRGNYKSTAYVCAENENTRG